MGKIKQLLKERGYTITYVAKILGIWRETLQKKICGKQPFLLSEALEIHEKFLNDLDFLEVFKEYKKE